MIHSTFAPVWRESHLGQLLALASERFEATVRARLAQHPSAPLTFTRLAERNQISTSLLHLLQHLPTHGTTLTDLAHLCGMRKQSMANVVTQGEAWGIVEVQTSTTDARARHIAFTPLGLSWLRAYNDAVAQAQAEFRQTIGEEVATVVLLGLEAYAT